MYNVECFSKIIWLYSILCCVVLCCQTFTSNWWIFLWNSFILTLDSLLFVKKTLSSKQLKKYKNVSMYQWHTIQIQHVLTSWTTVHSRNIIISFINMKLVIIRHRNLSLIYCSLGTTTHITTYIFTVKPSSAIYWDVFFFAETIFYYCYIVGFEFIYTQTQLVGC